MKITDVTLSDGRHSYYYNKAISDLVECIELDSGAERIAGEDYDSTIKKLREKCDSLSVWNTYELALKNACFFKGFLPCCDVELPSISRNDFIVLNYDYEGEDALVSQWYVPVYRFLITHGYSVDREGVFYITVKNKGELGYLAFKPFETEKFIDILCTARSRVSESYLNLDFYRRGI